MDSGALLATALSNLLTDEQRWRAHRLLTIQRARHLVSLGVRVADVCLVLGVSPATWHRRCRELDAALSAEGKAAQVAENDQAVMHIFDAVRAER
jgi:hypothetical protein